MRILLISFACHKTDGRLKEEIKVCKNIGETFVISQSDEPEKSNFTYVRNKFLNYLRFIIFCIKTAIQLGDIDLMFADNRAAIIPTILAKKLVKARYSVYDARELYIKKEVHRIRGKLGCIVEKMLVNKFDVITCANSFRAGIMKGHFKLKNTPIVFENIRKLELDDSEETDNGFNYVNSSDKKTINIISTSGCQLERKCDVLARAVCELGDNYRLFLVGYSDEAGKKAVEEIKKEYKNENIVILNWLTQTELKKLIKTCDIGIVSYQNDSTNSKYCASGKIYEYLFEGIPVVTTSNPPLKAMCEDLHIGVSDDMFLTGIKLVTENLEEYRANVQNYISTVNVDVYNKEISNQIKTVLMPKRDISKILFITSGYPTEGKELYTFLDALVCAMADLKKDCTVIYPVSLTHFLLHKEKLPQKKWIRLTQNGNSIKVLCPRIITFSNGRLLKKIRNYLNYILFKYAVNKSIKKYKLSFDVAYGHFLNPSGFVASQIGKSYGIPSCLAYGENTTYNVDAFGIEKSRKMIKNITACISVSSENTKYLIENGIISENKIATIPNAVDRSIFKPKDKLKMREKFGIEKESFVVAFVGYFTEIKGSQRLSKALDEIDGVHSIFIGSGELKPTCKNIDFIGSIPHDEIPDLLSAADVFVLPTIAEGCCNAIVEALSCGLPVISSDLPFNDNILNPDCSIRINTMNISEITNAICFLRDNEKIRLKMSEEAIQISKERDIKVRAEKILDWIIYCSRNF